MIYYYSAFGLRIRSNQPMPGLQHLPPFSRTDVDVCLGYPLAEFTCMNSRPFLTRYVSPYIDDNGDPVLTVKQQSEQMPYYWIYKDGTEFMVDHLGSKIWANWPAEETLENAVTYLLGPVLGFVLRLRGVTCLHASAVAVGNQAIALLGPPGAGKSTTAAVFARSGYPVLSDDVVPLSDQGDTFLAQPAYPRLRLWPESVSVLYGSAGALPRITPTWDKRYLDLKGNGYRFQEKPLPLAAVYVLGERSADPAAPFVETMPVSVGLITLVTNTFTNFAPDKSMRAREFKLLGRIVGNVLLRRVVSHTKPIHLSKLCHIILDDFHAFTNSVRA